MALFKKKQREEDQEKSIEEEYRVLHKKTIKEIIAPSGIDASKLDHMEIVSNVTRYARSFFVSTRCFAILPWRVLLKARLKPRRDVRVA